MGKTVQIIADMKGTAFEKRVADCYRQQGWRVLRGGWPDFLMTRDRHVLAVEAKTEHDPLSPEQRLMHGVLGHWVPIITVRPKDITILESLPPAPFRDFRVGKAADEVNKLRVRLARQIKSTHALMRRIQELERDADKAA